MDNDSVTIPKDVFMEDEFNVDRFLQEHCSKFGLHKLHKELGVYIKYLQSMMIDIVNGESCAIVNLSSELKVLQNKFSNISNPLGQLREEIVQMCKIIDINLNSTKDLLNQKENVSLLKSWKINELRILISSQKISKILHSHIENNTIDMEILERSVDQYILQEMYSQNCNNKDFKLHISHSTNVLEQTLNEVFLKSVLEKNTNYVVRCLQMYILMNTQSTAEQLYREKVLRPALLEIINEDSLLNVGGNLSDLYFLIIDYVKSETNLLLSIVHNTHGITGFNFILNSVWLEIYSQLKLNLSSIYAPGNPVVFHQRFIKTCQFLTDFEQCFWDNSERIKFLQHPSYFAQKQQWNLPVYYEIRHLQIVQNLEEHLPQSMSDTIFNTSKDLGDFKLIPSCYIWKSMLRCFDPDVYLPQLLDRFWRLNLQIISRLITWSRNLLNKKISVKEDTISTVPASSNKLTDMKLKFFSYLYSDILKFKRKLEQPFEGGLSYLIIVPVHLREMFLKCLIEPLNNLSDILMSIEERIVNIVYTECSVHVKQISQIPRLFRKTNRSIPTGPSSYLSLMSKPADDFYKMYKNELEDVIERILSTIYTKIIAEYKMLVESVLTSVTKTEESLRRLKKVRVGNGSSEASTVTDDQKIRLQVQLDVSRYCEEAKRFADISCVNELLSLIKDTEQLETK